MKHQVLFPLKDKSKKLTCGMLEFFVWHFKGYALKVNLSLNGQVIRTKLARQF